MSHNRREAFKIGFLQKCAEAGLTTEETTNLAKQAADRIEKGASSEKAAGPIDAIARLVGGAAKGVSKFPSAALWSAALGAPLVGGLAGYGAARLTDLDDDDVEALKKREQIDSYRSYIDSRRGS